MAFWLPFGLYLVAVGISVPAGAALGPAFGMGLFAASTFAWVVALVLAARYEASQPLDFEVSITLVVGRARGNGIAAASRSSAGLTLERERIGRRGPVSGGPQQMLIARDAASLLERPLWRQDDRLELRPEGLQELVATVDWLVEHVPETFVFAAGNAGMDGGNVEPVSRAALRDLVREGGLSPTLVYEVPASSVASRHDGIASAR